MKTTTFHKNWDKLDASTVERLQMRMLRDSLRKHVVPFSAYYRRVFAEEKIDIDTLRTHDDLRRIPFTSKLDLGEPRDFVLIPDERALTRRPSTIARALLHGRSAVKAGFEREFRPILMTATTGRSADSVPFLFTRYDLDSLEVAGRRMMEICDSRKEFRHLNAFPFAPHLAFWQMHYAGLGFNTFCLSSGGGKTIGTEGNVALIRKLKPDAIIGMPTFIYHLLSAVVAEGTRWPNLCRIVLGGEKVPTGLRRKLRDLAHQAGAHEVYIMSTYGFTEAKTAWPECATLGDPTGFHTYPDFGILEVIDPDSGVPVAAGEPGEIVYTPLDTRGTVVLRYRTGDLIEGGIVHKECPVCGRTVPRLLGRISRVSNRREINFDKIKGTLIDFNELENILDNEPGLGAWQIELRKRNDDPLDVDEIIVHAEALAGSEEKQLRTAIETRLVAKTEVRPNRVIFHDASRIRALQGVGKELKECRLVDHRESANGKLEPTS
jgi:phenylacetate-CoA ligase